jgi:serine/threonine protein kinase
MAQQDSPTGDRPVFDGKVRLEPRVLKRLLLDRAWSLNDFSEQTGVEMRTARKIVRGERIQISTARRVAKKFNTTMLEIVDPAEYRPADSASSKAELGTGEWIPGRALTPVITAANGLQFRVYSMTNAFEPLRRGRGKRYEFKELGPEAKDRLRHRFTRHLSVCDRVQPHPQFPICYATFPDSDRDTWWVIDEWLDGVTLAEQLQLGPLKPDLLLQVAQQMAQGVATAHRAKIILRELTPAGVFLAEPDVRVVLTDFELAKLTDDYPTVSEGEWPSNDYRAPEVGGGESKPCADVYSWGRIIIHALLGKLPASGREAAALKLNTDADRWVALLTECVHKVPSKRPPDMRPILAFLERERANP